MLTILIPTLIFLIGLKIGLNLGYCIVQETSEDDTATDRILRKLMKII